MYVLIIIITTTEVGLGFRDMVIGWHAKHLKTFVMDDTSPGTNIMTGMAEKKERDQPATDRLHEIKIGRRQWRRVCYRVQRECHGTGPLSN